MLWAELCRLLRHFGPPCRLVSAEPTFITALILSISCCLRSTPTPMLSQSTPRSPPTRPSSASPSSRTTVSLLLPLTPLKLFYFALFSLLTLCQINDKKFNEESHFEGKIVIRRLLLQIWLKDSKPLSYGLDLIKTLFNWQFCHLMYLEPSKCALKLFNLKDKWYYVLVRTV